MLLVESEAALRRDRHHRQKLHMILAAMRHTARDLRARGVEVAHRRAPSFTAGVAAHRAAHGDPEVRLLRPLGLRAQAALGALPGVPLVEGSLLLTPDDVFDAWARGRRRFLMEDFHRRQRARLGLLMDGDAPLGGQRLMWHSGLAAAMNPGLLDPRAAVDAVGLASAEGFARRVAGLMATGYVNHIERLMLFGNLMLTAGVRPREALCWFTVTHVDGHDWVMAPNVLGMALWADGGRMMTKPYAATGRYVQRMSDHCTGCRYDPGARTGPGACPFTTLYRDFLARNREPLALLNLHALEPRELAAVHTRAESLRADFTA